jgi:hypothetical protein
MAFRFYFYLCITLEIYNMEKIVIAILLLISELSNIHAQHIDLETQKKMWRKMVADTVPVPIDDQTKIIGNSMPHLTSLDSLITPPSIIEDYSYGLHQGLNVSLGASAFATFGKNVPHSGGFSQNIDLNYVAPITRDGKIWTSFGGYMNHTNWGSDNYYDVGLHGMLGYKIDDHWEAYIYGQLSVSNNYNKYYYSNYGPYGLLGFYPGYGMGGFPVYGIGYAFSSPWGYGMGVPGAIVLGTGIRYTNKNKTFSIGVNVEGVWYHDQKSQYYKQYDYPTP